ncbi:3'-5' exonuclease, partial [Klebsiella pneumoniae]|uniref:3'-5' exonuclease n=1 Tax=Klebsiella pneumoniae TaxID=573 RepID=UPI001F4A4F26
EGQRTAVWQACVATNGAKERDDNTVALMTVHACQGLAFPVVFLAGMKAGVFPHSMGDDEEERRLFYVAITRAQDELTVFFDDLEPSPYFFQYPEFHRTMKTA